MEIVRVDKNLQFNYSYFKKYSSDDSQLIFLILIYIAKERQYDLFGFGKLDPIKFCDEMKLSKEHTIWRKHNNPKQLINNSLNFLEDNNMPVFSTVFENALYCLATDIYEFSGLNKFYLTKEGVHVQHKKLNSIQFLKSIDIIQENKGKNIGIKKYYAYEVSQEFINNLSSLFFHVNIKTLSNSYKKSYEGLYLRLCNIIDECSLKMERSVELEFDEVKELLNIISEKNDYVKQKIKKAFDFILSQNSFDEKIEIEWFNKNKSKFKYGIKVIYKGNIAQEITQKNKDKIWEDVFNQELRIALLESFKRRYLDLKNIPIEEFKVYYRKWLQNKDKDVESKSTAYLDTCGKIEKPIRHYKPGERLNSWLNNLPNNYAEYM